MLFCVIILFASVFHRLAATSSGIDVNDLIDQEGFSLQGDAGSSGFSVSAAGDVNRDGFDDIIIGAPYAHNNSGVIYVIYGGTDLRSLNLSSITTKQGFTVNGAENFSYSGFSVGGAGDVNGDGWDDVIIGAPGYYNSNNHRQRYGACYVIYGKNSSENINLRKLTSSEGITVSSNFANFASSVSGAGDINNDGFF